MKNPISFKITFDEMGDVFRRNSRLQSIFLFVAGSGSLVLGSTDVEVVTQGKTYTLRIGIDILVCMTDGIVSVHLGPTRAEDIIGIKRC